MKIYTKTGDLGETGLLGGVRISKNHPSIEVCGALDELNSWIGVLISQCSMTDDLEALKSIQCDLFCLGGAVAVCLAESGKKSGTGVERGRVESLEQWMDQLTEQLPAQNAFILPGGTTSASWVFVARSVCRRAERGLVDLLESEPLVKDLSYELIYLNRLSDLLFLLGRKLNVDAGQAEQEWLP